VHDENVKIIRLKKECRKKEGWKLRYENDNGKEDTNEIAHLLSCRVSVLT
jgi:hypothetical protein